MVNREQDARSSLGLAPRSSHIITGRLSCTSFARVFSSLLGGAWCVFARVFSSLQQSFGRVAQALSGKKKL